MKTDIHPTYYEKATVKCSCGVTHIVGSTKEKMTVEICSECHPFYTGKEKLVDTAGRVEKFKTRQSTATTKKAVAKPKKTAIKKEAATKKVSTTKKTPAKKPAVAAKKKVKK